MTDENYKTSWKELCNYIEKNILQYSDNQHMCKMSCLRVQGLRHGRNIDNKHTESYGDYDYTEILFAFKLYKNYLVDIIKKKNIQGEVGKIAYATAIIRSRMGEISRRMENAKKNRERAESAIDKIDTDLLSRQGSEYKFANDQVNSLSNKYEDLW